VIVESFTVGLLQCNCTILAGEDSDQAIVIDPGDDAAKILEHLDRLGLKLGQIVCTHAHLDHVGAICQLQAKTGAGAALHQDDLFLFDLLEQQATWLGMSAPEKGQIDRFLRDGDTVNCPNVELETLHTPGHTPGSLTFHLDQDRAVLFTGDTLFLNSIGRTDLPGGSMPDILESIESKLMRFDDDALVIPGHGPTTTIGQERAHNPFLRS
jgi:hydroxyacylglutathione hydrolase